MRTRKRLGFGFDRFSGLYLWAAFIIAYSIWEPSVFPTSSTVHIIASEQSISAILAIAVLIPLAAGVYDLSIGAVINLSTVLATWLQTAHGWGAVPAIAVAILASVAIGAINAIIVVRLHVNAFIATLGTATVVTAVQTIVSGNNQVLPPTGSAWLALTQHQIFGFQSVVVYLIVIAILAWVVLDHTPIGRYLFATGGNIEAARLSGVRVNWVVAGSLIASATLAGIGGVLYGSLDGPSLTYGQAMLLPAFAAAFLGSTQLRPGRFNLWGTMIAVFVLATGVKGLQLITGVQWLNDMFNGVALVAAVSFAIWRQRAAGKKTAIDLSGAEKPPPVAEAPAPAPAERAPAGAVNSAE